MNQPTDNRMPPGIPFIIANEFAERFCYYGINAILAIYMVRFLQFGEGQATEWQSLFKSGAYFFPLLGAIVSDVFLGKFRTIIGFSLVYCAGCAALALVPGETGLALGLALIAIGTGGIKPCVSTNVGDQFTNRNEHLIERAFSWFYMSVNAGSVISILLCPWLLEEGGPRWAFGVPGAAMFVATLVFWMGRHRFAVVPPAGRAWLREVTSAEGLQLFARLAVIYVFVAVFWSLWDQSNGTTWTLQAQSGLMDKHLGFGIVLLPAQIQFVNALFILLLVPTFSYVIYPLMGRFFTVTPLRKIGIGFFVAATSFVVIAWIEQRIQQGIVTSLWWQILAYGILTASEVMVSITALEFSYRQAPLRIKSFVMALYLLSISAGNLLTAVVADAVMRPVPGAFVEAGAQATLVLPAGHGFVAGQKIDFGGSTGITVMRSDGTEAPLAGTYVVGELVGDRAPLLDVVNRKPLAVSGQFHAGAEVATYRLVGPQFFLFFAGIMTVAGIGWVFVAMRYREKTYVRED
ncbi:MAG: MFS transporter [Gammaproteobacteria bacterium]